MFNAPKTQRSRRKSAPGSEHIKHRRTRSGCYTCRSRRVKVLLTRRLSPRQVPSPNLDSSAMKPARSANVSIQPDSQCCHRPQGCSLHIGCRKGKRECNYPEPPPPKGSGASGSKSAAGASQQPSPSSSPDGEDDDEPEQDTRLDPIMDEDEEEPESAISQTSAPNFPIRRSSTTSSFSRPRVFSGNRQGSETPSYEGKSESPALSSGGVIGAQTPAKSPFPDLPTATSPSRPDWTFLPHELQFYLGYFYENITHHHYCAVNDADDFFRSILTSLALRDEALLYAVIGFSAYHHSMKNPNGGINEFLQYYSRSVTLLLGRMNNETHTVGTLLTILQLATIEVCDKDQHPWIICRAT